MRGVYIGWQTYWHRHTQNRRGTDKSLIPWLMDFISIVLGIFSWAVASTDLRLTLDLNSVFIRVDFPRPLCPVSKNTVREGDSLRKKHTHLKKKKRGKKSSYAYVAHLHNNKPKEESVIIFHGSLRLRMTPGCQLLSWGSDKLQVSVCTNTARKAIYTHDNSPNTPSIRQIGPLGKTVRRHLHTLLNLLHEWLLTMMCVWKFMLADKMLMLSTCIRTTWCRSWLTSKTLPLSHYQLSVYIKWTICDPCTTHLHQHRLMRRSLDGPTGQQHLQFKFRLSQHEDPYWWRCSTASQQHTLHANMDPYNEYRNQQLQMIMQRVQTLLGSLAVSVTAVSPKVSRSNILLLTTTNSNVVPKSHACLCGRLQKTTFF